MKSSAKKIGGNRRPQTFRDCLQCKKRFGPLNRLSMKFCSVDCCMKYRKGKPSGKKGKHYPHLRRARVGNCIICGKEYRATGDFKTRKQKYCSKKCFGIGWAKFRRPNIIPSNFAEGDKNKARKGDFASYSAMHKWIYRQKGKPSKCEHCGRTDQKKYEWANVDHSYKREVDDYMRLCTKCHRKYDYEWNVSKK